MNVTPGFIPGAKRAGGDIVAHALGGEPQERKFPIMNDACAIGGALLPLYANFAPDRDLFLKLDK